MKNIKRFNTVKQLANWLYLYEKLCLEYKYSVPYLHIDYTNITVTIL